MAFSDANADLAADMAPLDDLPRTLRREHEARARERETRERETRERETRERDARERTPPSMAREQLGRDMDQGFEGAPSYFTRDQGRTPQVYGDDPIATVVTRFNVPFFRLMFFFMKAVLAAVPALIMLGAMLWFAGKGLEAYFPELVRMKILITFPNG